MSPAQYDAWYDTARGRWIGNAEYRLLSGMLPASPGASVLDVGCGTGYFTRRLALDGLEATGIDLAPDMIRFAAAHRARDERYVEADALALPFSDGSFDHCVAVTTLCFVRDEHRALAEMLRVARIGVVLGLLNRHSLLYLERGREGGQGAYRGAHWHTPAEARALFDGMPADRLVVRSAVLIPSGGPLARTLERIVGTSCLLGAFLAVSARRASA